MARIEVTVDGVRYHDEVEPRLLLVHYLRERLGKVGTPIGCDTSNCGACTVHVDGASVKSCTMLAVQADGTEITTIEGLAQDGQLHPIQQAFHEKHALQCGYCTPGMIMASVDLLNAQPAPERRGDPARPGGQPLPLHRLPEHRPRGPPGRREGRGGDRMTEEIDAGLIAEQIAEHPEQIDAPDATRHIGRPLKRKEDRRLITGQTRWTDNIQLPGLLHMAILRSPIAHARINRVDVSAALERPGVIAAFSAADLADELGVLPCAWPVTPDMVHPDHHPLATDEVRYVGEAVAVVVARDRYAAADALEAIEVDYEPLPAVIDMEEALKDEVLVHSDKGTNKSFLWPFDSGDYDAARAQAEAEGGIVFKRRYIQQRLIPAAMEPRAVVVEPLTEGDEYTVYSATQIPHILRLMLALTSGIPEHKLRVVAPDVGGGFGSKLNVYAEEVIALVVARKLGRPVKWTESRSEGYQATIHGRDQIQDIEIAADPGRQDPRALGRPPGRHGRLPAAGHAGRPGARRVHVQLDLQDGRATGSAAPACSPPRRRPTPTAAPAGPRRRTRSSGSWTSWPYELGIDPMELRRRNWIKHEEFPYTTIAGLTYDSGNYEAATDEGAGACSATTSCAASSRSAGTATTRCSSASASRRTPRCAGWPRPGCSARCRTAPAAGRPPRSGCCRPARSRSSPAPPRTARAT